MLDYAIVVATRNRLDMLRVSLPLFVAQTRPAARIVVVDRSDDHEAVRAYCESVARETEIPLVVRYGDQANLPAQRNQGLDLVTEPVTMYPDDDSLWFPDTAEHLMDVYEADRNRRYGAISATPVAAAPPGVDVPIAPTRRLTNVPVVMAIRNRVERLIVPAPFVLFGAERTKALRSGAEQDGLDHPLVPTIGGYRMTFRTEVLRELRFDPTLGSRVGYATHEDIDIGLRVLASGSLVAAAPRSLVFHCVAPGARAAGFDYGFFHVLNYLYICAKVMPERSLARRRLRRYLRYKLFLYAAKRRDQYGREVHQGAKAAYARFDEIMAADRASLPVLYGQVADAERAAHAASLTARS